MFANKELIICCIQAGIPLKTKENPDDDAYSVQELYDQLTDIYS